MNELETSKELEKAFVSKHLSKELRNRGLMVGSKDGSMTAIKAILGNYYLNFVNKLQYVLKVVAKKKIVTVNLIQSAYKMV